MADVDVAVSEEVAGSETEEAVVGSDPTSDGAGSAAVDTGSVGTGAFGEPFEFTWHDDTKWSIKDRSELARKLQEVNEERRHSTIRSEDLQVERGKITAREKSLESALKKAQEAEATANESHRKWTPVNEAMSRYPGLEAEIKEVIQRRSNDGRGSDPDSVREALLAVPEFQEMKQGNEEWKKAQAATAQERVVAEAVRALKSEIPDYDEGAVQSFLDNLAKVPQRDGERKLRQVAHYAIVGMARAGILEQKKADMPSRPGVSSTPGKSTTGPEFSELSEEDQEAEIVRRLKAIPE